MPVTDRFRNINISHIFILHQASLQFELKLRSEYQIGIGGHSVCKTFYEEGYIYFVYILFECIGIALNLVF